MTRITNVKNTTKFKRSIKAISPVIATLLMIAIAVVASLVAYAWVMGYIGFQTNNTGQAIQIQSYAPGTGTGDMDMDIYVQNVGQGIVEIDSIYINDDKVTINSPTDKTINNGDTIPLNVALITAWTPGTQVEIKVTTTSGTFSEIQGTGTSSGNPTTPPVGNVAPVAAFAFSATNLVVSFDGSGSTDSDGTIASYAWTFGDTGTGTGATPSHTYASAGTYTVRLTVTDDDGATNYIEHSVTVSAANVAPVAAFAFSATNLVVSFDGSGSTDSDGTIASYAWTFGDTGTGTGATPSHTYASAGTYTVRLTVTDDDGATNYIEHSVTVSAANVAPVAAFAFSATNLVVSFDGSGSTDSDGTIASYAWTFGDTGTGTGATPSHTYASAGTYTVRLTVTDDDGATNYIEHSVTVTAAPAIYVTSETDSHAPTDLGSLGSFANMQSDTTATATLTEADADTTQTWVTPTSDSGDSWSNRGNARDGVTTNYASDTIGENSWSDYLTLSYSATTGTKVRYWMTTENSEVNRILVEVHNTANGNWEGVYDGAPTTGAWSEVTYVSRTTDGLRIRVYNDDDGFGDQSRWSHIYEAAVLSEPINYRLDQEVQFQASINSAYTRLEIKTGAFSGEGLSVERWTGSTWTATGLGALAANSVNTFNGIPLTGNTLQLRFIDATQSSDTTSNTWQIDYVRLIAP